MGSLAFLALRHSSFRVRWVATVVDEWYSKKGYYLVIPIKTVTDT